MALAKQPTKWQKEYSTGCRSQHCALFQITSPSLAQTAYTVAIVSSGINAVGTIKCAQMIGGAYYTALRIHSYHFKVARQHVHVVMAVTSFLLCVIVLVIPLAVNIVCPDNTPEQVPSSPLVLVAPSSVQPFKSWSCLQTATTAAHDK
ncbi:hypothetical protein COOONC_24921 [Cooperia oncophora]